MIDIQGGRKIMTYYHQSLSFFHIQIVMTHRFKPSSQLISRYATV